MISIEYKCNHEFKYDNYPFYVARVCSKCKLIQKLEWNGKDWIYTTIDEIEYPRHIDWDTAEASPGPASYVAG
jgi:hypothetical protein